MKALIGYTGFVGRNLEKQFFFDEKYNSKNIHEIKNKNFDVIFCSGVSAVKWLANQNPEKDIQGINKLIECLRNTKTKIFILVSTIDVYDNMKSINEDTIPNVLLQDTYGKNRYYLENWVRENFENHLIIRLPALFGMGLKKNFIYDVMNPIPSMLTESKMTEFKNLLSSEDYNIINKAYLIDENKNYKFKQDILKNQRDIIYKIFKNCSFTSLLFTDSRSSFPFYYLDNLRRDIELALKNKIRILNLSVEPITCKEIAREILNLDFNNEMQEKNPVYYDMLSKYSKLWNSDSGYLYSKQETIKSLKAYFRREGY